MARKNRISRDALEVPSDGLRMLNLFKTMSMYVFFITFVYYTPFKKRLYI